MKIENIGQNKLKILLNDQDMIQYNISYDQLDYNDSDTKKLVLQLLNVAKSETGFDAAAGKLFIEVFPDVDGGCIFYFTLLTGEKKKGNEKNILINPFIFEFDNINCLSSVVCVLFLQYSHRIYKSSLYLINDRYRLVVYPLSRFDDSLITLAKEYKSFVSDTPISKAYTIEHGKLLIERNAVDVLYSSIC